ncbi:hypothetical protein VCRA2119O149_10240001 [Vibrio crassostreae]|nr:hypothetical protein VCRA2119O149_10240001 [Vibrio crassostreae]
MSFNHSIECTSQLSRLLKSITQKALINNWRYSLALSLFLKLFYQAICVDTASNKQSIVKEVIQPQVPLGLPCYDFTPVMNHTVVNALPKVKLSTSGAAHSHGVTGGVYKARERIHRGILIHDY